MLIQEVSTDVATAMGEAGTNPECKFAPYLVVLMTYGIFANPWEQLLLPQNLYDEFCFIVVNYP